MDKNKFESAVSYLSIRKDKFEFLTTEENRLIVIKHILNNSKKIKIYAKNFDINTKKIFEDYLKLNNSIDIFISDSIREDICKLQETYENIKIKKVTLDLPNKSFFNFSLSLIGISLQNTKWTDVDNIILGDDRMLSMKITGNNYALNCFNFRSKRIRNFFKSLYNHDFDNYLSKSKIRKMKLDKIRKNGNRLD